MRFIPEKEEVLALLAVWFIWPVLICTEWAVSPLFFEIGGSLPLSVRFALEIMNMNRHCLPSLIGTGLIVLAGRFSPTPETKRFIFHLISLTAFAFTVTSMLCLLALVRPMK